MSPTLAESRLPLPLLRRGKVREVYEVDAEHLLLVASDRVSAFDVVMREADPAEGRGTDPDQRLLVRAAGRRYSPLTTSPRAPRRSWSGCPGWKALEDQIAGRAMLVRRAVPVPFECVVRGYLSGPPGREYQSRARWQESRCPPGWSRAHDSDPPLFSPATKAETGHDINVTFDTVAAELGTRLAGRAPGRELCAVPGGTRSRGPAGNHHRGHQIRVRDRCGGHPAADR